MNTFPDAVTGLTGFVISTQCGAALFNPVTSPFRCGYAAFPIWIFSTSHAFLCRIMYSCPVHIGIQPNAHLRCNNLYCFTGFINGTYEWLWPVFWINLLYEFLDGVWCCFLAFFTAPSNSRALLRAVSFRRFPRPVYSSRLKFFFTHWARNKLKRSCLVSARR